MKKYKQSYIKSLVTLGVAVDLAICDLQKEHFGLEKIGYSIGIYGLNGGLLRNPKTGKLYAITARNTNLFQLF